MSCKFSLCALCSTRSNHHRQHLQGPTWPPEMCPRLPHKARKESLGAILGASWSLLGALLRSSWGTLGSPGSVLGGPRGLFWGVLKSSQHEGDVESDLEATWSRFGSLLVPSWGPLGALLGPSWLILGPLGAILGPSWSLLGSLEAILGRAWRHIGRLKSEITEVRKTYKHIKFLHNVCT